MAPGPGAPGRDAALCSDAAPGRGTLVLLNDEIHGAREVTTTNTTRVHAFAWPAAGRLGVVATVGRGNMPPGPWREVRRAVGRGVVVVLSSRAGAGRVPVERGDGWAEWTSGRGAVLGAGDLNPQKARVLLILGLAESRAPRELARLFRRY